MKELTLKEKLMHELHYGVATFEYKKIYAVPDEIRKAHGTLNEEEIIKRGGEMPKGTGKSKDNIICYWDIDKCSWRSFREDRLVSVEETLNYLF